jgi:hypothetical protein
MHLLGMKPHSGADLSLSLTWLDNVLIVFQALRVLSYISQHSGANLPAYLTRFDMLLAALDSIRQCKL